MPGMHQLGGGLDILIWKDHVTTSHNTFAQKGSTTNHRNAEGTCDEIVADDRGPGGLQLPPYEPTDVGEDSGERDEDLIHGHDGDSSMDVGNTTRGPSKTLAGGVAGEGISMLASQFGRGGGQYRREQQQGMKRPASEIYSPPLVTEVLEKLLSSDVLPGLALDIATYDGEGSTRDFHSVK